MSEWISVEDRLPELGVLVLIFNPATYETMHTAKLTILDAEDYYWFSESNDDYLDIKYTPYWQPLPEPPK